MKPPQSESRSSTSVRRAAVPGRRRLRPASQKKIEPSAMERQSGKVTTEASPTATPVRGNLPRVRRLAHSMAMPSAPPIAMPHAAVGWSEETPRARNSATARYTWTAGMGSVSEVSREMSPPTVKPQEQRLRLAA